jgi:GntR family transcriptional regulator/MocR family aminotransferase
MPEGTDEPALLAAAAERDVGMEGLSWQRFAHGGAPGMLLGYCNLSEPAIEQGVRLIAQALAQVGASSPRCAMAR